LIFSIDRTRFQQQNFWFFKQKKDGEELQSELRIAAHFLERPSYAFIASPSMSYKNQFTSIGTVRSDAKNSRLPEENVDGVGFLKRILQQIARIARILKREASYKSLEVFFDSIGLIETQLYVKSRTRQLIS